jgi:hypothetical protein
VNGQSMTSPAGNDDTVELMLTPEQMLDLAQAAESTAPQSSVPAAGIDAPVAPRFPATSTTSRDTPAVIGPPRWHQRPIAKMGANTLLFVGFVWWSGWELAAQPGAHPQAAVAAAARPIAVLHETAPVAVPPPPPVQIINPFDKTEVFQFPAGTSEDESRDKVAQILMQRARERQSHWEHLRQEFRLRTANVMPIRKGPGS